MYGEVSIKQLESLKKTAKSKRFNSKKYNLRSLKRIVEKYNDKSDLILLISPFHPYVIEKYKNEIKSWKKEVELVLKRKINIYDYSNSILDDNLFNDPYHLNNNGVTRLKEILITDKFFNNI